MREGCCLKNVKLFVLRDGIVKKDIMVAAYSYSTNRKTIWGR